MSDVPISSFKEALDAPRAMIVLDVPWSVYAVRARQVLQNVTSKLRSLGITFSIVDEEAEETRDWLNTLGIDVLGGDVARGAGSILWLENGEVIQCSHTGGEITDYQLLKITRAIWQ